MTTVAVVVAAGRGERFGGGMPKQYRLLAGRPVLRHSLERLLGHPRIDAVKVVLQPEHRAFYDEASRGLRLLEPVPGGGTRQESVRRGLESLVDLAPRHVVVHDAVRPLADAGTVDRVLAALERSDGAIAASPVADTLKRAGAGGRVTETVDRAGLWRAQTPQAFRFDAILSAHRSAAATHTDDAGVAEAAGLDVVLVAGNEDNLKITTEADLARAERLLSAGAAMEWRTGSGFDVHRFAPGDGIMLCGLRVPHDRSLEGHSDADAGLHALTDAILGAIGAGDIGQHFPPSDPQWRGKESAHFLRFAAGLVAARGGRIAQADVTVICERPKVAPYRGAMAARVADILGIEPARVSIKATTTEGLGFTGRREGLAALAVATVALPFGA
jgi:2-C-methyl-D-erythritol 4-phosphate cytidylyltransferase/2-C-methyl-D-erythritol 2,4-cyclodiphosphate synthase